MSWRYARYCEGQCGQTRISNKKWMCPTCEDNKEAKKAYEYRQSPLGKLDDVHTIDELKDWLKENWQQ